MTVRIDADTVVASTDDACTWAVDPGLAQALRHSATKTETAPLSAAAAAGIAEARHAHPRPQPAPCRARAVPAAIEQRILTPSLPHIDFADVLTSRRSQRLLGPLDSAPLLSTLAACIDTREVALGDDGWLLRHRAAPSAGARHGIELLLLTDGIDGLGDGVWHLDGEQRSAARLTRSIDAARTHAEAALAAANLSTVPPATILLVADFAATLSRYPAGSSLVWRDAGALASTVHLALFGAGFASTIVGIGGLAAPGLVELLGWPAGTTDIVVVGALVVGGQPTCDRLS